METDSFKNPLIHNYQSPISAAKCCSFLNNVFSKIKNKSKIPLDWNACKRFNFLKFLVQNYILKNG